MLLVDTPKLIYFSSSSTLFTKSKCSEMPQITVDFILFGRCRRQLMSYEYVESFALWLFAHNVYEIFSLYSYYIWLTIFFSSSLSIIIAFTNLFLIHFD